MRSRIVRGLIIAGASGLALIGIIVGGRAAGLPGVGHALATPIAAEICELREVGAYSDDGRPMLASVLTCWDADWNLSVPGVGGHR